MPTIISPNRLRRANCWQESVQCGGGRNHRADLGSGVLIKDNHIAACGGVQQAIERARARAPHTLRIEIEVTTLEQLEAAIAGKADIVLLDNMSPTLCHAAVTFVAGRALVAIEVEIIPIDVDLMDELVIVGESQRFAAIDRDVSGPERAALLNDGMRVIRKGGDGCQQKQKDQKFLHFDTTWRCIGARRARKRF